jgi:hypothetical protein
VDDDEWRETQYNFTTFALEVAVTSMGQETPEQLVEQFGHDRERESGVLLDHARTVVDHVRDAFEQAAQAGPIVPGTVNSGMSPVPDGWEDLYELAARTRRIVVRKPGPASPREEQAGRPNPTELRYGADNLTAKRDSRNPFTSDDRPQRQKHLSRELETLHAELAIIKTSIARMGDVRSMTPLLTVLAVFAVVGVVQPIIMLSVRPIPAGWLARGWVVVSFTVALCALILFLWREVHRLAMPENVERAERHNGT